jgi:hypothetical protein
VMACAAPADAAPDNLAQDLTAAFSAEGCGRAGRAPDIWYFNLVYFTGPVRDLHGFDPGRREATGKLSRLLGGDPGGAGHDGLTLRAVQPATPAQKDR